MKDAFELIDYDDINLIKINLETKEPSLIYRKGNQMVLHTKELSSHDYEKLLKIEKNKTGFDLILNQFKFDKNGNIGTKNSAWFLLKPSKSENKTSKYKISEGDIIRIGRITSKIKNIFFSGSSNTKYLENNNNLIEVQESQKKINHKSMKENSNRGDSKLVLEKNTHKANKLCRICYIEENDEENPLVRPCTCSGSMKYIHLNCLKHWINTRSFDKVDSNGICSIFMFKPLECELCKTKFPDFIRHNGKLFSLIDFQHEFKSYMTLESLTRDKNKNKYLYVISLENNGKIKLGRGHDADILLSDISISRVHCLISIENKNIFIEDNNSKFGTLILIQAPSIQIVENLPLYFQVGRTFFNCRYKKSSKLFQCCGVSERPNLFYYHNQNKVQVNAKKVFTVKTDFDDDDDDDECLEEVEHKTNNDKNDIIIEESTEKLEVNKKLQKTINRGTTLFEDSEIDLATDEENKNLIENEISNNLIIDTKEEDKNENENNKEKTKNNNDNPAGDNKSESIYIESENINDIPKDEEN